MSLKLNPNKPAWKIILSNYRITELTLPSGKNRIARVPAKNTWGKNKIVKLEMKDFLQSRVLLFGADVGTTSNKFRKESIGMGARGFLMLGAMIEQYKYKYAIIYPNDPYYEDSVNVALRAKAPDANTESQVYKFPHHIFISNNRNFGLNTPIFEERHGFYNLENQQFELFDPKFSNAFNALGYNENDNATYGDVSESPENWKFPSNINSPKGPVVDVPSLEDEETPRASSSKQSSTHGEDMNVDESAPRDKGKHPDGTHPKPKPKPQPKASSSGVNNDDSDGEYANPEHPNTSRRLFDPDVNRKDTLKDNRINTIGNKYINEKFRFHVDPKLLNHSPFETDIIKKHGRTNTYKKEIDKKVKKLNIYKKFFEY